RYLYSFPTRRSSDLYNRTLLKEPWNESFIVTPEGSKKIDPVRYPINEKYSNAEEKIRTINERLVATFHHKENDITDFYFCVVGELETLRTNEGLLMFSNELKNALDITEEERYRAEEEYKLIYKALSKFSNLKRFREKLEKVIQFDVNSL